MQCCEWTGWDRDGSHQILARYRAEIRDDVCVILIDGQERSYTERPHWGGLVDAYPQLADIMPADEVAPRGAKK
jgi:hypothetical protein